jgi:hypothetical protein
LIFVGDVQEEGSYTKWWMLTAAIAVIVFIFFIYRKMAASKVKT